jgi:hypothetical protein
MPQLLTLPRELRDEIYEYVLLTPDPSPHPPTSPRALTTDFGPGRLPPFQPGLMGANKQVRAEVQERASKITIPLVLDVRIQISNKLG